MRRFNVYSYFFFIFIIFTFYDYNQKYDSAVVAQDDIVKSLSIELLKDKIYYFPSQAFNTKITTYIPLRKFDLIFTAHDLNSSSTNEKVRLLSNAIPGKYTHILMYLGKANGFAYGVEMNADPDSIHVNSDGIQVRGKLYLRCLGSDFGKKKCPVDERILERYDFLWAKRLNKNLRKQLLKNKDKLINKIKQDLILEYPFQLPFSYNANVDSDKKIKIIENGGDCSSYIISLFEEIAHVCPDNVRMSAKKLKNYYLHNKQGNKAIIPLKYNILFKKDLYIKDLLTRYHYFIEDNEKRKTACSDSRRVSGITTPDLIFHSPSFVDIF